MAAPLPPPGLAADLRDVAIGFRDVYDKIDAVDNTTIITEPPARLAGVVAPRRIRARTDTWNLRDFGMTDAEKVAGFDPNPSAVSYHELFDRALSSGETVEVSDGVYPLREAMSALGVVERISDTPISMTWSPSSKVLAGGELAGFIGGLFRIGTESLTPPEDATAFFSGGLFDTSDLPTGMTGLSVFDVYNKHVSFEDMVGFSGESLSAPGMGGGDTFITTHNCMSGSYRNIRGRGYPDLLIYISDDNDANHAPMRPHIIDGVMAWRCSGIIGAKRSASEIMVSNVYGFECINGIYGSPADGNPTNQGRNWTIDGVRLYRMQGRPIVTHFGVGDRISNIHIQDFGKMVADPSFFTQVQNLNYIAGVDLQGSSGAEVSNAWIGFKEWSCAGAPAGKEPHGVVLKTGPDATTPCTDNKISATVQGAYRGFVEGSDSLRNQFLDVKEIDCLSPSVMGGGNSYLRATDQNGLVRERTGPLTGVADLLGVTRVFEIANNVIAHFKLSANKTWQVVVGTPSNADAGRLIFDPATDKWMVRTSDTIGRRIATESDFPPRPEDFGGTDNAALAAAVAAANASGKQVVFLEGPSYGSAGTVDFAGVTVLSSRGSALLCTPKNAKALVNVTPLGGKNSSKSVRSNIPVPPRSGMLLIPYDADRWYLISRNLDQNAYTTFMLRRGNNPLGYVGPFDQIRCQRKYYTRAAYAYQSVRESAGLATYTGTWVDRDYNSSTLDMPSGTNTTAPPLGAVLGKSTPNKGDYVDLLVQADNDGKATLGFMTGPASSNSIEIYIDRGQGLGTVVTGPELVSNGDFSSDTAWSKGTGLDDTGPNLVTNGTFDVDANWTKGTGWTIANGKATHASGSATDIYENITFVNGRTYHVVYSVTGRTQGSIRARLAGGTDALGSLNSANGTYSDFITSSGNTSLRFGAGATFDGSIDDVTVYDTVTGAVWTISGGVATHTPGIAADISEPITFAAGQAYVLTYTVTGRTAGAIRPKLTGGVPVNGVSRSGNGTFTEQLVAAPGGNTTLTFTGSSAFDGSIDDVSVVSYTVLDAPPLYRIINTKTSGSLHALVAAHLDLGTFGSTLVRVVHKGSGTLYLAAMNMDRPEQARREIAYTHVAAYTSNSALAPVANDGASDYAMFDEDVKLIDPANGGLIGSVHGREAAIAAPIWMADGVAPTFSIGIPIPCKALTLDQKTQLAGKGIVDGHLDFFDSFVSKRFTIGAGNRPSGLYLGMSPIEVHYDTAVWPTRIETVTDGVEYPLGGTDLTIQRDTTTGQEFWTYSTIFDDGVNLRGRNFIKSESGSFHKLYSDSPLLGSEGAFNGVSVHMAHWVR